MAHKRRRHRCQHPRMNVSRSRSQQQTTRDVEVARQWRLLMHEAVSESAIKMWSVSWQFDFRGLHNELVLIVRSLRQFDFFYGAPVVAVHSLDNWPVVA